MTFDPGGPASAEPSPGDRDLDAAEYVLGLLPPDLAHAIEALALRDPAVSVSINAWQDRLAPLAALIAPQPPPPELWQRLALATGLHNRRIAPRRSALGRIWPHPAFWHDLALWRGATFGALALAAGLAVLALSPKPLVPEPLLAALSPQGSPGAVFLVRVGENGQATVVAVGQADIPAGRALELWAVRDGMTAPESLGLLPSGGRTRLQAAVGAGTRLLVSQEPTGGSPTGAPTGPVVYAGLLTGD